MITIQGVFDGVKIIPSQQIPMSANTPVEITFFEEGKDLYEYERVGYLPTTLFDYRANEREREVNNLDEK